jgi:ionotropic glutamate receptor
VVSNLSKFLMVIWVFAVLILTSSYTASLTSMLTVQKLRPAVTDVNDLLDNGDYVGYQEGSFVYGELLKMNFDPSKLRSYSTPAEYADALSRGSDDGGVAAVFDEVPYLRSSCRSRSTATATSCPAPSTRARASGSRSREAPPWRRRCHAPSWG